MPPSPKPSATYDLIVIGGGASGMMAAGVAAKAGDRVLLLEKNSRLGVKLAITGGGRCNITNAEHNIHKLLAHYGQAKSFLHASFAQFGVADTFVFFKNLGLHLITQKHGRVFPATEKAPDVVKSLKQLLQKHRVTIRTNSPVRKIIHHKQHLTSVMVGPHTYTATNFIVATGGLSHTETGSTGDGFRWLQKLGHQSVKPTPALVPLATKDTWSKKLSGTALDKVAITFFVDGKKQLRLKGRILCAHFGLTGPLIMNASKKISDMTHEGDLTASINLFPAMDPGTLDKHLTKTLEQHRHKTLANALRVALPKGSTLAILSLLPKVSPDSKAHEVRRDVRKQLGALLSALPITIMGLMGYNKAIVTDGGIDIKEIDERTMRSRKVDNLFITGDMLHVNRPSGGYSLQLCWTTGFVAGTHAHIADAK